MLFAYLFAGFYRDKLMLQRQGKLMEASAAFDHAVQLNPHSSNAMARAKSIRNFVDPTQISTLIICELYVASHLLFRIFQPC